MKNSFFVKLQAPACNFAKKQTHLERLAWESISWQGRIQG